jgi:branched-chain amino acid transport system permease protein
MLDLLQAIVDGVFQGAVFALAAVGLSLVFGVTNMVNFAHGDLIMMGMYLGFACWAVAGLDPLASIPIAAMGMGAIAFGVYRGVIRPVLRSSPLAQLVITFGVLTLLRGVAQVVFTAAPQRVSDPLIGQLRVAIAGVAVTGAQLACGVGALACTAALAWLVHRTETGRALQAVGEDAAAASLMGINPDRIRGLAWALAGTCAGIAGALLINSYSIDPLAGSTFGIMAFVAVALGGFGSIIGPALAGLALGVAQSVVGLYLPGYTLTAALLVYVLVLVIRPQGLRGAR